MASASRLRMNQWEYLEQDLTMCSVQSPGEPHGVSSLKGHWSNRSTRTPVGSLSQHRECMFS